VAKEIEATRTQLPSVIEFRNREVDKYVASMEKLVANWEKFAARKGLSVEDQAEVDKTTVEIAYTLGHVYIELGNLQAAEPHVARAIAIAPKLGPLAELEASFAFTIAGKLRRLQGKYAEAAQHLEKAFLLRKSKSVTYWDVMVLLYELAQIRKIQGEFGKSLEMLHLLNGSVMREAAGSERAGVALWAGEYKRIEDDLAPALKLLERNTDLADPILINAFAHLADYHLVLGSPERAEEPAKELLKRRESIPLPNDVDIAEALIRLSRVYVALGDADKAASLVDRAEKVVLSRTTELHPIRIAWQMARAEMLVGKGDLRGAGKFFQGAHDLATKVLGAENYATAKILARLGAWHLAVKDDASAYSALARASETLEKTLGLLHPDTAGALDNLARVYIAQNKPGLAIDVLKKSVDSRDRHAARIFGFVSEMQKLRTMDKLRPQTDLTMRLARTLSRDDLAVGSRPYCGAKVECSMEWP
jgi:tetratricopeptide (TPR) repeat protein